MFSSSLGFDIDEKLDVIRRNKWKIIGVLGATIILIIIISSLQPNNKTNYKNLEDELVGKAKIYVADNAIEFNVDNNAYLDLNTLGVDISNTDCSVSSGVLINRDTEDYYYSPYLMCRDYSSKGVGTETKLDKITLYGGSVVVLKAGEEFVDPGYSVSSNYDVTAIGTVGRTPGIYSINYIIKDNGQEIDSAKRDVIVGEYNDEQLAVANANANAKYPVITLKGEAVMTVQLGGVYNEPGFIVADKTDKDMEKRVQILGSVNTSTPGEYILTYEARNTLGYVRKAYRKVIVVSNLNNSIKISSSLDNNNYASEDVAINLSISGDSYNYTVLPNGTRTYSSDISYAVGNNSNYVFKVYDKDGKFTAKEVKVSNIDNYKPSGTCSAIASVDKTEISVDVQDNGSGIDAYSYSTGVDYSQYVAENNYTVNNTSTVAYVRARDKAGNISVIMCNVKASSDALIINGASNVKIGESITLTATEKGITNNNVTWSIDGDSSIASVSSSGVVTGLKEGTVNVKATTPLGKSAVKAISVNTTTSGNDAHSDIEVPPDQSVVYVGQTLTLTPTKVFGKEVTGSITWVSSDTSKATINSSGVVTGVAVGQVTITATSSSGETANHKVAVIKTSCGVEAVRLTGSYNGSNVPEYGTITINVGQTANFKIEVPSYCGTPAKIVRTDGGGDDNRDLYLERHFLPHKANRDDISTAINGSSFIWTLKGLKPGKVSLSMTIFYFTTDNVRYKGFYHLTVIIN